MTFADLKTALLNNAKPLEICEAYHEARVAADYADLIEAGLRSPVWIYRSQVATDLLLAEIPEADMNDRGVYTTGTFSITDPDFAEIYIVKNANVTLTLTGTKKLKVWLMGGAILTAIVGDNAHLEVNSFDTASITATASDTSSLVLECSDNNGVAMTLNDDSCGHLRTTSDAVGNVTANNNAVAKLTAFQHSSIMYTQADASAFYNDYYQKAIIYSSGA